MRGGGLSEIGSLGCGAYASHLCDVVIEGYEDSGYRFVFVELIR